MSVAIHGFGRIGRSALKNALKESLFTPISVSDIKDIDSLAAVFAVDTNYGRWSEPVTVNGDQFVIGGREIRYIDSSSGIPDWESLGVDLVVDCTGMATRRSGAEKHLEQGAKRVLVSAPSKTRDDADVFLLPGINFADFNAEEHKIVSMASCTTNALAPVVKVILEQFGIEHGLFSTIHAYTNTQSLTDQPMSDRRDSWAAAENIIPSSSGAAKALQFIWPDLKITGKAYRIPVRTGSIAELNLVTKKPITVDAVNAAFTESASKSPLEGIMDVLDGEWASSRIIGDSHSSIVDLPLTQVMGENFLSCAAWYDNEWGYAARLAQTAAAIAA